MSKKEGGKICPDLVRNGYRLNNYLPALQEITKTLSGKGRWKTPDDKGINDILKRMLPHLNEAFSSNLAFIADGNGRVVETYPEAKKIAGKVLMNIPPVNTFVERDGFAVLEVRSAPKKYRQLKSLSLYSLLFVRFETPVGLRYIGVANGRNTPPFLGADKVFLDELMKILLFGLRYGIRFGKENEQKDHFLDRYIHAQDRGDWEYLCHASENYFWIRLNDIKEGAVSRILQPTRPSEYYNDDTIMTDHLDARLCNLINSILPRVKSDKQINQLLNKTEKVIKSLDNNEQEKGDLQKIKEKNKLRLIKFQRTVLAVTRIRMFIDNYKGETITADDLREKKGVDYTKLSNNIWTAAIAILDEDDFPDNCYSVEWSIDLLRTKWQQIYYLSRRGMMEPGPEKLEKVNKIYKGIWKKTVSIFKNYLEDQRGEVDLYIDSDWMIAWLGSNILLSKRLKQHYDLIDYKQNKLLNPIAKMRYLKYLSHHILYVLHCARFAKLKERLDNMKKAEQGKNQDSTREQEYADTSFKRPPFADVPVDVTSSLSEAQLYLMSEYAYREIGVHRELRIFERLSRQLSHELPLYAASNFYRDHLYHVMDVCLIGELLLRSLFIGEGNEIEYEFLANIFSKKTFEELLQNWYIAALCHDLGYVIEQSEKFLKPVSEIKGEGISGFSEKLKDGLTRGKRAIQHTIENITKHEKTAAPSELVPKLIKERVSTDHGIAAWLHLRQWIKDTKCNMDSLIPALTAILRHNLSDQEFYLFDEPLSFLLILCDHIQEWGRPIVGPEPLARGIMEGLRFVEKPELDRKIRMNKILIKGLNPREIKHENIPKKVCDNCVLKDKGSCKTQCLRVQTKIAQDNRLEFKLPHTEAREADFEPCISWLTFCRDLQSINCREKELPFQLSIIMEHTPPRIWSALEWNPLEMDIFEEFASTCPTATYLLEWIAFARNKREGIEYDGNRDKGIETFTIKLHELGKPLSRDLSDEHWKDFFKWKWQWLSHKYTTSNLGTWIPEQKP